MADLAARSLAEEHYRTTSALRRQREDILSASSDTKREITDLERTLRERELRLSTLISRQHTTDVALSSVTTKHETFLKGPHPAANHYNLTMISSACGSPCVKHRCYAACGSGPIRGSLHPNTCCHAASATDCGVFCTTAHRPANPRPPAPCPDRNCSRPPFVVTGFPKRETPPHLTPPEHLGTPTSLLNSKFPNCGTTTQPSPVSRTCLTAHYGKLTTWPSATRVSCEPISPRTSSLYVTFCRAWILNTLKEAATGSRTESSTSEHSTNHARHYRREGPSTGRGAFKRSSFAVTLDSDSSRPLQGNTNDKGTTGKYCTAYTALPNVMIATCRRSIHASFAVVPNLNHPQSHPNLRIVRPLHLHGPHH